MLTPGHLDKGFRQIVAAAKAGQRCPTNRTQENPTGELRAGVTTALVKAKRIRVEIFAHNWRVVEIIDGPHAGLRTAPPPYKFATKPYKVLDGRAA